MCSDITTEAEKVEVFVNNLYGHQKQLDNDVKDILAATILRFYHEFTVLLSNQPDGKFSGDNIFNNQFCYAVTSAKENAGVSNDTFIAWQAEVCAGFTSRNQYSLSGDWIDEPELGIKPFAKIIANQAVVLDNMSKKVHAQSDTSTEIKREMELLQKGNKQLQSTIGKMEKKLNSWEEKFNNIEK